MGIDWNPKKNSLLSLVAENQETTMLNPSKIPVTMLVALALTLSADAKPFDGPESGINRVVNEMPIKTFNTLSVIELLDGAKTIEGPDFARHLTNEEIVAKALYSTCDITKFTRHNNVDANFNELYESRFSEPCSSIRPYARGAPASTSSQSSSFYTSRTAKIQRVANFCDRVQDRLNKNLVAQHFKQLLEES